MVLVNYSGKEINAKVVYYGPGLCGKTTNLEFIYGRVPQTNRGKMVSMKTRTERTLFFDFLPLNLGDLAGFQTRFLLYTVPGQIYYNATRKLVLKGVDALVFVADSQRGKMDENLESLQNLRENLQEHGLTLDDIPLVMQYNKRDLPDVHTVEEMEAALNPDGAFTWHEAVATSGEGVFETFKGVARLLLAHLSKSMGITGTGEAAETTGMAAADGGAPTATSPPTAEAPRPASAGSRTGSGPAGPRPTLERTTAPEIERSAPRPAPVIERGASNLKAQPRPEIERPTATTPTPSVGRSGTDSPRVIRVPVTLSPDDVREGFVLELHVEVADTLRNAS
jgi:hypothetical protein